MSSSLEIRTTDVPGPVPTDATARAGLLRRLVRDPLAVLALSWLLLVVLIAVLAPLLTSADPTASQISDALAPMCPQQLLGTDGVGRDVWAQLLFGARTSLIGAVIVVLVSLAIGLPAGLLAGFYRGRLDGVASWIVNLLMAQPAIIILLVVLTQFGRSTALAMLVFGFLIAPGVYRLVRGSVVAVREELFVDAARVSGLKDLRIVRRHILPVVVAPTVIQMSQILGIAIVVQAGLEFLGLGSANQASWGGMLNDAFKNIYTAPLLLLWPSVAIVLTVTACGLLGNALRDALGAAGRVNTSKRDRATNAPAPRTSVVEPSAAEDGDALLSISGLTVAYPTAGGELKQVVGGISLSLRRGEVLGLVGESGSGKSQTAFSVLGLLPRNARTSAARLMFDGQDLNGLDASSWNKLRGCRIGYIPQEPMSNLDPSARIGSQLVEPMRHHLGLSKAAAATEALRLLERVGIQNAQRVFDSYPHQISGGMAQRVLIAGAVSCGPDLLIADEPTTALDVTVQAEVLDLIRELQAERNMGVLLVTHNFGVVADVCDHVAVMRQGEIVEHGPVERLFSAPEHEYTRMLLDSILEDGSQSSNDGDALPPRPDTSTAPPETRVQSNGSLR